MILSGTGTDGTRGLEAIKAAGGITLAQDEQSAGHTGMPLTAIRFGCVDAALAPADIARELARIALHPNVIPHALTSDEGVHADDDSYRDILSQLRAAYRVDFDNYRDTTLKRCIARRMVLRSLGSMIDYALRLKGDPAELGALCQDILINVTSFFRDPDAFEVIKREVLPAILENKGERRAHSSLGSRVLDGTGGIFARYRDNGVLRRRRRRGNPAAGRGPFGHRLARFERSRRGAPDPRGSTRTGSFADRVDRMGPSR